MLIKLKVEEVKTCGLCEEDNQPVVYLRPVIIAQIEALSTAWNEEWLGYLYGTVNDKDLVAIVNQLFVPEQEVSYSSVDVDAKNVPNDANVIGTVHSHHTMGSFFSGTDTGSIAQHHPICLVYSHKDGIKGLYRVSLPCGNYMLAKASVLPLLPIVKQEFIDASKLKLKKKVYQSTYQPNYYRQSAYQQSDEKTSVFTRCACCGMFFPESQIRNIEDTEVCLYCAPYFGRYTYP